MAKQMNYLVPESGITLPNSYWYPAYVNFDLVARICIMTWLCFADSAAKQNGLIPIARREFTLQGDSYNAILATVLSNIGLSQDGKTCEEQLFNILGFGISQSADAQAFFTGAVDVP